MRNVSEPHTSAGGYQQGCLFAFRAVVTRSAPKAMSSTPTHARLGDRSLLGQTKNPANVGRTQTKPWQTFKRSQALQRGNIFYSDHRRRSSPVGTKKRLQKFTVESHQTRQLGRPRENSQVSLRFNAPVPPPQDEARASIRGVSWVRPRFVYLE